MFPKSNLIDGRMQFQVDLLCYHLSIPLLLRRWQDLGAKDLQDRLTRICGNYSMFVIVVHLDFVIGLIL